MEADGMNANGEHERANQSTAQVNVVRFSKQ